MDSSERRARNFRAEVALVPRHPDPKATSGSFDLQSSKTDEAAKLFGQILLLRPHRAKTPYELGNTVLDRGQVQEATWKPAAGLTPHAGLTHVSSTPPSAKNPALPTETANWNSTKELKAKSRERTVPRLVERP